MRLFSHSSCRFEKYRPPLKNQKRNPTTEILQRIDFVRKSGKIYISHLHLHVESTQVSPVQSFLLGTFALFLRWTEKQKTFELQLCVIQILGTHCDAGCVSDTIC